MRNNPRARIPPLPMENTIRFFFDSAVRENPGRLSIEYLAGGERLGKTFGEMDVRSASPRARSPSR